MYVTVAHFRATANVTANSHTDAMIFECRVAFKMDDGEDREPPRHQDTCISYYEVIRRCSNIFTVFFASSNISVYIYIKLVYKIFLENFLVIIFTFKHSYVMRNTVSWV